MLIEYRWKDGRPVSSLLSSQSPPAARKEPFVVSQRQDGHGTIPCTGRASHAPVSPMNPPASTTPSQQPVQPFQHSSNLRQDHSKSYIRDSIEDALWSSISSANATVTPTVSQWADIFLPGRSVSTQLIVYDRTWNSWVHYALEYPRFQHECEDFMDAMESGHHLHQYNPFWLAVYFSTLCVGYSFRSLSGFGVRAHLHFVTAGLVAHDGRWRGYKAIIVPQHS
jgi:hypothetical protein